MAQTVAFFFHNADSAGLRVTTLPARFTPKENPAYAGSWKIVVTVNSNKLSVYHKTNFCYIDAG